MWVDISGNKLLSIGWHVDQHQSPLNHHMSVDTLLICSWYFTDTWLILYRHLASTTVTWLALVTESYLLYSDTTFIFSKPLKIFFRIPYGLGEGARRPLPFQQNSGQQYTWLPYLLMYRSNLCKSWPPIFKVKNQIFHHFYTQRSKIQTDRNFLISENVLKTWELKKLQSKM